MSGSDDLGLAPADLAGLALCTARAELNDRIRAVAGRGPLPTVLAASLTDGDDQGDNPAPAPLTARFAGLVRAHPDDRG